MRKYYQLTECQRYQIYALKKVGHDQQTIAATLAVSPSTICRELRRNRGQRGYRPRQAHQHALTRRQQKAQVTDAGGSRTDRSGFAPGMESGADCGSAGGPRRSSVESGAHLSAYSCGPTGRRYVVSPSATPSEET